MQNCTNYVLSVYLNSADIELVNMAYFSASTLGVAEKCPEVIENERDNLDSRDKNDIYFSALYGKKLVTFVDEVVTFIKKKLINEQRVILNIYGQSKDGVIELMLSQYLNKFPQDKLIINFISTKSKPRIAAQAEMNKAQVQLLVACLGEITETIYYKMSSGKQESTKAKILRDFSLDLSAEYTFENKQQLINALRNVIAVALQRDQCRFSLFSTTASGTRLLTLLKQPRYQQLADLVMGESGKVIRYRDLRCFVMGSNDESFFNAKHRKNHYQLFAENQCFNIENDYQVKQDNFSALLSSR